MTSFQRFTRSLDSTASLIAAVLISLILAFSVFGCRSSETMSSTGASSSDSDSVAVVNHVPISEADYVSEMQHVVPDTIPEAMQKIPVGRLALQSLIQNTLLLESAQTQGVQVTPDEVDSHYNDLKLVQDQKTTRKFDDLLKDQGYTVDQFKNEVVKPAVAQFNLVTKGVAITDADLQSYYQARKNTDFNLGPTVHVERIVVRDKATADSVYAAAVKDGNLNASSSLSLVSPSEGGASPLDYPVWINPVLSPQLKTVSKEMVSASPGGIIHPVLIDGAWWVMRVIETRPLVQLPFDQVKSIVRWDLMSSKSDPTASDNLRQLMQQTLQSANITVNLPQYQDLPAQMKGPAVSAIPVPPATSSPGKP
jgi:hypothetical protein